MSTTFVSECFIYRSSSSPLKFTIRFLFMRPSEAGMPMRAYMDVFTACPIKRNRMVNWLLSSARF